MIPGSLFLGLNQIAPGTFPFLQESSIFGLQQYRVTLVHAFSPKAMPVKEKAVMGNSEKRTSLGRLAILLFVIGALLGIDSVLHLSFMYKLWPLVITMLGIGFIGIFKTRDRREALYLTVGIYLTCFSGLALWCDFSGWGSLKTLWPLFVAFLGIAVTSAYVLCRKKPTWLLIGLLLISTAVVFFLVFSISHDLWWSVFLLAGMSVWISERDK
jgi:hypothetical protein